MTTTEPAPQKWTERNAAALALVDRLPPAATRCVQFDQDYDGLCVLLFAVGAERQQVKDLIAEIAPDAVILYRDVSPNGQQRCSVRLPQGFRLEWFRTVTVRVVEDDQP